MGSRERCHGLSLSQACRACGVHVCACDTALGRLVRLQPEPVHMPKVVSVGFQVGDRVECVRFGGLSSTTSAPLRGRTFVIADIVDKWLRFDGGVTYWDASRFVLAQDAPAASPSQAETYFKAGDRVLCCESTGTLCEGWGYTVERALREDDGSESLWIRGRPYNAGKFNRVPEVAP